MFYPPVFSENVRKVLNLFMSKEVMLEVQNLVQSYFKRSGPKLGDSLMPEEIKETIFQRVWNDACEGLRGLVPRQFHRYLPAMYDWFG